MCTDGMNVVDVPAAHAYVRSCALEHHRKREGPPRTQMSDSQPRLLENVLQIESMWQAIAPTRQRCVEAVPITALHSVSRDAQHKIQKTLGRIT